MEAVEAAAAPFRSDRPCISDAMKSFATVLAAAQFTEEEPHEMPHLLTCARVVLRLINSQALPLPNAWAEAHPQGDDESAMSRMDAITNYKAW